MVMVKFVVHRWVVDTMQCTLHFYHIVYGLITKILARNGVLVRWFSCRLAISRFKGLSSALAHGDCVGLARARLGECPRVPVHDSPILIMPYRPRSLTFL